MNIERTLSRFLCSLLMVLGSQSFSEELPPAPPQDQGIPYTRSAQAMALKDVGMRIIAYPGSPYAIAHGYRTRLDPERPLKGKAVETGNVLYVPKAFAAIVLAEAKNVQADAAPLEIANRYVHQLSAPAVKMPAHLRQIMVEGSRYVSLEDLARVAGIPWARHERGLFVIGAPNFDFLPDPHGADRVITLFDTPDLLADPDIATQHIPILKRQGKWTDHVKHTPEQLQLLEGSETKWPLVPKEDYSLAGFEPRLLGSPVPPPGVYPRLIMSPQDLPMWRKEVQQDPVKAYSFAETEGLLKSTWLDPDTIDGKMFDRLASGKPLTAEELSARDRAKPGPYPIRPLYDDKPMIKFSHTPYVGHCLVAILQLALLNDDDALGKKAAAAAVTYMQMREATMDKFAAMSDSEFGSQRETAGGGSTAFRYRCSKADHMSLPWLLDYGGKYMTPDQIESMRRIITKTSYGMADSHAAGSMRWIENNHTNWHTTIFLMQFAIEGLPGSDPENFPRASRTIRAFCEFGIDKDGVVFESNGKSGAGFNMFSLNLVALARRGENFFGHPHLRALPRAQVLASAPDGSLTVTSGTYAGKLLDTQFLMLYKNFYPDDPHVDWLLNHQIGDVDYSDEARKAHAAKLLKGQRGNTRLPVFSSPVSDRSLLLDSTFESQARSDLGLPLSFSAEEHGLFSAFSDDGEQAAWINLLVRENGYLGGGHHHADSGLFHFSSDGVNWFRESPNLTYDGNQHNHVRVDGKSTPNKPAATGHYLGSSDNGVFAYAAADVSRAYNYAYVQQLFFWDEAGWWHENAPIDDGVEFEDDPRVVAAFKGTQRYKMRSWWPSYNFSNWIPTCRTPYNPVQYALRSFGLVRGKHNYAVLMDEVKKDDDSRHYEWSGCVGRGVWLSDDPARAEGLAPEQQLVLGWEGPHARELKGDKANHLKATASLTPKAGDPQLLVCLLNQTRPPTGKTTVELIVQEGPFQKRFEKRTFFDNVLAHHQGEEGKFRILMIPFRRGDALPKVSYDENEDVAQIQWAGQKDQIRFSRVENRLVMKLDRL